MSNCEKKLTYSASEAAQILGMCRNTFNKLLHSNGFPMFRVGKKIVIPIGAFEEWLNRQANFNDEE